MTSIKSSYSSDIKGKTGGIVRAAKNNFGPQGGGKREAPPPPQQDQTG